MNNQLQTTEAEHKEMVYELAKPGNQVLENLTPENVDLWHAATGVNTEAGELLDAVKKLVIYNKPLDKDNVIEELGDIELYLEQTRQNLNITRAQCLRANIEKLRRRFPKGYTDRSAQFRADKVCVDCNGEGTVFVGRTGVSQASATCDKCNGTGRVQ
jgi:NTP pyrophosphatase (non-canonical NTP hydrolase)